MLNYSYKIYNSKNNKKLHQLINTAASIWNHCVLLNNRHYKLYKCSIPKGKLEKHIAKLRKKNSYWKLLNSQSVQEIVQRYEDALKGFFKKIKKRKPKLKKWKSFSSFVFKQSGFSIHGNELIINGIGKYKFYKSREHGDIRNVRIKRNSCGELFIIICLKVHAPSKQYRKSDNAAPVGCDFGMKIFLTLSDNTEIQSPLFFKKFQKQIKKENKKLSTAIKGSNNRRKRKLKLAKTYKRLSNLRTDFAWKLSHSLCKEYSHIFIEDLNISAMKKLWGKKISDLCFSDFVVKLKYIATKYDTVVHEVGRFYPSSKTCSCCGYIKKDLSLKDRIWICPTCDTTLHRDVNAAINIKREGILSFQRKCKTDSQMSATFVCMEESRLL